MMRKKKNGFWTFCFSLLPGAGEMYLGFMKMGMSIMGLFFVLCAITSILQIGVLSLFALIVWFYSFFHVNNLAGLSDEEFLKVEDEFLFNLDGILEFNKNNVQKHRKIIATVLIVLGIFLLWNGLSDILYHFMPEWAIIFFRRIRYTLPKILTGFAIIAGGFYMIKGKKQTLNEEEIIDVESVEVKDDTTN